tara:strand:+ start:582 stop:1088 length:507 start_codon:yes stop_codon:yes gene_type:complete
MTNINQFKANLVGAGPRNNRFEVFLPRAGNKIQFLCKTASLPGQTIEEFPIKYKGLTIKLAGDRTFENWEVGIYNDNDWSARKALEDWMTDIVPLDSSTGPVGYEYMEDMATVSQMDRADNIIATYNFFNMWPTVIGPIELDTEGGDAIEIFNVTFAYSHFERAKPTE